MRQRITIPRLTRSLPYYVLISFAAMICTTTPLRADTTWVAGEVYGTWTRDGKTLGKWPGNRKARLLEKYLKTLMKIANKFPILCLES
jgi:hypothetical protein